MLNIFVNYFGDSKPHPVLNLVVSRFILVLYLIWVILTTNFGQIKEYEVIRNHSPVPMALNQLIPETFINNVDIIAHITILLLVLFGLGYKIKYTGYLSSFFVCYLGIIRYQILGTWSTQMYFAAGVLIMFYAVYNDQNTCRIDSIEKTDLKNLNGFLHLQINYKLTPKPLKYFLLLLGIMYFGSGFAKVGVSGLEWMTSTNFGRQIYDPINPGYSPILRDFILQFDYLLVLMAIMTLIVELGFIFSIIYDKLFNIFIFSIILFHIGIAIIMGPVFVYTTVFLLLFVNWSLVWRFLDKI